MSTAAVKDVQALKQGGAPADGDATAVLAAAAVDAGGDSAPEAVMMAFWQVCAEHPRLQESAEIAYEESITAEERAARAVQRRAKMRGAAETALARFASLSEAEKQEPQNQGSLDLYTDEAMSAREAARDDPAVCRELERWWSAAAAHMDRDKNAALDWVEYQVFYRGLVKLLDPGAEMELAEVRAAMEADFAADAGADGKVTRDEFQNSVFELADNWTCSTDAAEYADFLRVGYDKIFGDLDDADVLRLPEAWLPHAQCPRTIVPMSPSAATEFILQVYDAKATADAKGAGSARHLAVGGTTVSLAELALGELRTKFNPRSEKDFRKRVKALVLAMERANDTGAGGKTFNAWIWLFSRLLGCYSVSGRVRAIPAAGVSFIVRSMASLTDVVAICRAALPSRLKTTEQKACSSGKAGSHVGYVGLAPTRTWLRQVNKEMGIRGAADAELLAAVDKVLDHLCEPIDDVLAANKLRDEVGDVNVARVCGAADALLLVSNVWCAKHWDVCENVNAAVRADAERLKLKEVEAAE